MNTAKQLIENGEKAAHAGDFAGALTWFQRAMAVDSADPVAQAWCGQALCRLGRRMDGLRHLAAAGRQIVGGQSPVRSSEGDLAMVLEILAQIHAQAGFDEALALARAAARTYPRSARAQYMLAATCGQLNLRDESLVAVQEAARLAPGDPGIEVLQASLEADARLFEAAYDRLDRLIGRLSAAPTTGNHPRQLFRALKEMARVLDALGEYDGVFAQVEAAAQLVGFVPEYAAMNLDLVPNLIRQNMAGFNRRGMVRFAGDPFEEQPRAPVFVMGFYRSGTTLVQEVLRTHPQVFLSDEVDLIRAMERELHCMQPGPDSVAQKLDRVGRDGIVRLRAAYWSAVTGHHGPVDSEKVFVDKFTLGTVDLGLISTVFPDARVLFLVRDPRDVCVSCALQLMVPTHATRHLLTLADAAGLYAQVMGWWLLVREQLSLQHLELRYEDAVGDFDSSFRRVFDFLGLPWREEARDFHVRAPGHYVASPSRNQVTQPLYRSSVARWQHYEKEMAPVQHALAPYVARFGYPPA